MSKTIGVEDNAANRLAYHVARMIQNGALPTRSAIDDALLDYLEVGGIDGPATVPEWIVQYEAMLAEREG